jgi:hypothetical protein
MLIVCVVLLCVFTFWVPCCDIRYDFSIKRNNVRFIFTSSCLYDGSYLIYVICVCLRIVVSNTYCVVFFLLFVCIVVSSTYCTVVFACFFVVAFILFPCVPNVSLDFAILIAPSVSPTFIREVFQARYHIWDRIIYSVWNEKKVYLQFLH